MTVSDLKLKLFRQIDSLEKNRLEELYGVLLNFFNGKKDVDDWNKLTEEQKQGLFEAIEEIESGQGIPNEAVISKVGMSK
ncbi:MAG: hypothetical protein AB9834_20450 [Lentimicrobium sp.]